MLEKPAIPEDELRACLQNTYDFSVLMLDFLPLGLDVNAGVYRLTEKHGISYLLKAKRGLFYEPSGLVPRYLRDQGIVSIVAPIPTKQNKLWTQIGEWMVSLYPFIDGDTGWKVGMTDKNWRDLGTVFKQVHETALPPTGFPSLKKETLNPTAYIRWLSTFETQHVYSEGNNATERTLLSCWRTNQSRIHKIVHLIEELAHLLQEQTEPEVICHADLHPGNILRDSADNIFVIDWDDVMLASKERDFIFVDATKAEQELSPFFQGYGETKIHWSALTYYRCERVVQDMIVCTQEVFFRDDLEEETKIVSARLFEDIFTEGNEVDAAFAVAAHVPSNLISHDRNVS